MKNFSQRLYKSRMKKKKEADTKSSIWELKNAQTSTDPRTG